MDEIRGSPEDSYKIIPKFAYILELNNLGTLAIYIFIYVIIFSSFFPYHFSSYIYVFFMFIGSVVEYKVYADSRFLYFFMALSASISGWQHCRPIISIDGTSLKNKYGDILLSASTPDANDQIFPLVFCVVDSENDSSWTWFCNQLKKIISGRNEVVIGPDRHQSICTTIKVVFSNILHCIYLVHLLRTSS